MATLGANVVTLADWVKMRDPNGKFARIAELLNQRNNITTDMPFMEGNLETGHQYTQRTGLPGVYWRMINQGIPSTKSTEAQVTEACAELTAKSTADKKLAHLGGNVADFRMKKALAHLEAMKREFASTLFYGNAASAQEEFTGLAPRYSSLSAGNAQNIVSGGGSGSDNTSIFLIGWGPNSVYGVFPKGMPIGLQHEDRGIQDVTVTAGLAGQTMRAYVDWYEWHVGLALEDWRYVVRICNIDVSDLIARSSPADLDILLSEAYHRIESLEGVNPVLYMNRTVYKELDIQGLTRQRVAGPLTDENIGGKVRRAYRGIPVEVTDAIVNTEATVS